VRRVQGTCSLTHTHVSNAELTQHLTRRRMSLPPHPQRYSFDALRCSACRAVHYCGSSCQKRDWTVGGHRLVCVPAPRRAQPLSGRAALDALEVKPW
jgi:radical SAM protein with 4Fe4S-binding SPASM domain